jgi:hypothetical protein
MPAFLTRPLRSHDLAQQSTELGVLLPQQLRSLGDVCNGLTVGPTAAGDGEPANSPLLPLDSAEHRLKLPQYLRSVSHKCRN